MIDSERLYEAGILFCACECGWDNDGKLEIIDRYSLDYPPIPRFNADAFVEFSRDAWGDPDDRIYECPECGEELHRTTVNEREVTTLA